MKFIKTYINKLLHPTDYSSEAYISHLRKCGVKIGKQCYIYSPQTVKIDASRPYLLEIGDQVVFTRGVTILTHDYSHTVMRKKYGTQHGDAKSVKIGNNVFLGIDSLILMGTTIGNNVIIGAKSVVRGTIPDNVVVAGNPARIVATLDEYHEKRKARELDCAKENVRLCIERLGRTPTIKEMGDAFAWLYLPRNEQTITQYSGFFHLSGDDHEKLVSEFMKSTPVFESYEKFLEWAISD